MDHRHTHTVSVAGVIIDGRGRALLTQRRDNGHWEAPGGVLERDEDITAGLLREIHEETGLTVEPVTLTGVYKNMTRAVVALVFRWVTADEVKELASEAFAVRVLDAMQQDQPPAIRHHDGTRLLGVPQRHE